LDHVLCLHFNAALSKLTATEFVKLVLVDGLGTRHLIVGDDFRFGCDRSGDFNMLSEMGAAFDFTVQDTETLEVEGERVSSTLLRQAIATGRFCSGQPAIRPAFFH
jgi:riboflavin kinase/FMN adenylyltransferase